MSALSAAASPGCGPSRAWPPGKRGPFEVFKKDVFNDGWNECTGSIIVFLVLNRVKTPDGFLTLSMPQFFIYRKEMKSQEFGNNL